MKISVLGDGGWGTALALRLQEKGHNVCMWSIFPDYAEYLNHTRINEKYLPGVTIPKKITITSDIIEAVKDSSVILFAVPARHFRDICILVKNKTDYHKVSMFLSVSKGIEHRSLMRMSEIIQTVLDVENIGVLSGPSHAEAVAQKKPTAVVAASSCTEPIGKDIQKLFMSEHFRVYTTSDVIGVEIGAALKNVLAIAVGICDGLRLGDNAKAAVMTRGLAEITRLAVKMGAQQETISGLAGIGDIIVTCMSAHGRNLAFGRRIGQGMPIKDALQVTPMVIEGYYSAESAHELVKQYGIEMPIAEQVYQVLYQGKSYIIAVEELMRRGAKTESY